MTSTADHAPRVSIFTALRNPGLGFFLAAKFLGQFSAEVLVVALIWQLYDITGDAVHLGYVGLVQFLPAAVLVMVTGTVADRFRRRSIMVVSLLAETAAIGALLLLTLGGVHDILPIYVVLFVIAVSRAFFWPAQQSLAPNLVPPEHLATTIAASSAIWQSASISAPIVGGLIYDWYGIEAAQGTAMVLALLAALCVLPIPKGARRVRTQESGVAAVVAGFRYIWQRKVVLGAISLDLFAVLLGGAAMLLPIYAKDILDAGPEGMGYLRAAGGAGALGMALWLAWRPIRDYAGAIMFGGVIAYGAFTLVFALSETLWLSVAALALMGASDMVSVNIRSTLIQLRTPDQVRGRVNAVNMVFVGASNELGGSRAGFMADWIGAVAAALVGGVGIIAVSLGWLVLFPELRRERRLDGKAPAAPSPAAPQP